MHPTDRLLLVVWTLALLLATSGAGADPVSPSERAERKEAAPKRLEGVDVVEHLDSPVALDLVFNDEDGNPISLREIADGSVPIIFTLNYSNCPMLCGLQLPGLAKSLKQLEWTAGKQFQIITVSLDPTEKPARARESKQKYLGLYGRPEAAAGWHFLTGSKRNIEALAESLGIEFGYNEKRDEYVHPAVLTLVTPDGRIGRYLYGIEYHPKTLRLSLADVSEGKVGSTVDRLILYCFHYDETEGRYGPVALNIMRLGGALAVLLLGGALGSFWIAEVRRKKRGTA
jgi:protein SCO1/2